MEKEWLRSGRKEYIVNVEPRSLSSEVTHNPSRGPLIQLLLEIFRNIARLKAKGITRKVMAVA